MPDDATSAAAAGAAVRDGLVAPRSAGPAMMEFALFGLNGLDDIRDWLVADGNAVSARADIPAGT